MSSSPTGPTSTTASSSSSPSEPPLEWIVPDVWVGDTPSTATQMSGTTPMVGLVACGALAQPAAEIAARRGWAMDVHPLPPLLHNQPHLIAGQVRELVVSLRERAPAYDRIAIGYADCGTYGALDS